MSKIILHNGTESGATRGVVPGKKPSFAILLLSLVVLGVLSGLSLKLRSRQAQAVRQGTEPPPVATAPAAPEGPEAAGGTKAPAARPLAPSAPGPAATALSPAAGKPAVAGALPEDVSEEEGGDGDEPPARAKEPAFKTRTEQLISMVESIPPGVPVPPLPISPIDNLEADADESAAHDIVIGEEDSEKAEAHKIRVGWTKVDLAAARKEGWSAVEYLKALEDTRNEDAAFAREKRQEFDGLLADPGLSDDDCLAELEKINAELEERGLPPIVPRYEDAGEPKPSGGPAARRRRGE